MHKTKSVENEMQIQKCYQKGNYYRNYKKNTKTETFIIYFNND